MNSDQVSKKILKLLDKGDSNFKALLSTYERRLLIDYKGALKEIKNLIANIFEKYGDTVNYSDLVIYNRLTNLERSITAEITRVTKKNIETINTGLKEFYSDSYYRSAFALEASLNVRLGYGLINPRVIEASLKNPLDRITWPTRMQRHSQKLIQDIRSELTRGLIKGEGYGVIAKAIDTATGIGASKSIRIVRTEGHRVQSVARVASFDKGESAAERLGIKSVRVWIHSGNPREPRPDHIEMNDVEADDEGIFTLPDGTTTEGPGLTGIAEHDINCGCTTGLKFKNLETISLSDYVAQNYDQWREEL